MRTARGLFTPGWAHPPRQRGRRRGPSHMQSQGKPRAEGRAEIFWVWNAIHERADQVVSSYCACVRRLSIKSRIRSKKRTAAGEKPPKVSSSSGTHVTPAGLSSTAGVPGNVECPRLPAVLDRPETLCGDRRRTELDAIRNWLSHRCRDLQRPARSGPLKFDREILPPGPARTQSTSRGGNSPASADEGTALRRSLLEHCFRAMAPGAVLPCRGLAEVGCADARGGGAQGPAVPPVAARG